MQARVNKDCTVMSLKGKILRHRAFHASSILERSAFIAKCALNTNGTDHGMTDSYLDVKELNRPTSIDTRTWYP